MIKHPTPAARAACRARRRVEGRRRRRRGVTMVEVLVALLVFSLGILGAVGMQARAIQLSVDSEDRARAALMANEIVTAMWTQRTTALPAATVAAWTARLQDPQVSGLPQANAVISAPDAADIVTVTITWQPPHAAAASTFVTRVSQP
jgi:type IV pilus assembly protein PilV